MAATELGDRQVSHVELQDEDTALLYVFSLSDGTTMVFDAKTGLKSKVVVEAEKNDEDEPLARDFKPVVSLQDALKTARATHAGVTARKVALENEHGVAVYSVRFTDGYRVDVDAANGSVVRAKAATTTKTEQEDTIRKTNDDNGTDDDTNEVETENESSIDDHEDSTDDSDKTETEDRSGSNSGSSGSGR